MLSINIIDNHDEALEIWEAQKIRNFTVTHIEYQYAL